MPASATPTYLLVAAVHDLIADLLHVVLHSLRLVLVLQTERLVLDDLGLLLLNSLGGGALLFLLFGRHVFTESLSLSWLLSRHALYNLLLI